MFIMDDSKKKEQISVAYISTICAMAGILFEQQKRDEDSTDASLSLDVKLDDEVFFNSYIRVQLKSTSSVNLYSEDENSICYKLKVKNYNDLCARTTTPMLLMLLILPEEKDLWVNWSEEELLIRGRMYWQHFPTGNYSNNSESVTVTIPKTNIINDSSIVELMRKVAMEELV